MMSINLALVIVLSAMVAVLWCNKCDENFNYNRAVPIVPHDIEGFSPKKFIKFLFYIP